MRLTSKITPINVTYHDAEVFTHVSCITAMENAAVDYYVTVEDWLRHMSSLTPNTTALEPLDKRNIERRLHT